MPASATPTMWPRYSNSSLRCSAVGVIRLPSTSRSPSGVISAFGCYVMWGFMPLLFMAQAAVGLDSFEILAHRALWAVAFAGLLVLLAKQGGQVRSALTNPKTLGWLTLSTVLIGVNFRF